MRHTQLSLKTTNGWVDFFWAKPEPFCYVHVEGKALRLVPTHLALLVAFAASESDGWISATGLKAFAKSDWRPWWAWWLQEYRIAVFTPSSMEHVWLKPETLAEIEQGFRKE